MTTQRIAPGPRSLAPLGHLPAFQRDPLTFCQRLAQEYGDVARFRTGPEYLYLVSHPDDIRDILVTHNRNFQKSRALREGARLLGNGLLTSDGEAHLRQRRLVQPAFHRQRLGGYAALMAAYAARYRDQWQDGQVVDMHRQMMALTLAVAGKTLFNADVEHEASEVGQALTISMETFRARTSFLRPLLDRLPLPMNRRAAEAAARLDAIIYRIIAERRADSRDRGDLLSMLLMAQDVDGSALTDRQVRDEAMTLFLAGHETTANALSWTWYLLAQHPEVEALLHAEVDEVLGDRVPGFDDAPRLEYTRRVIAEAMRLYPPAWIVGRQALGPYSAGGFVLPAGATILMSQWVVHHDARWYPDPYCFDPERWTAGADAARPRFSYFPFGGGPRVCIGEQFAWTEGILVLATLARRWRARLVTGHPVVPRPLITLRPAHGVRMPLERREDRHTMAVPRSAPAGLGA